jgi:hypothetical protein
VVKESRNVGHDGRAALLPFEFVGFAVQVDKGDAAIRQRNESCDRQPSSVKPMEGSFMSKKWVSKVGSDTADRRLRLPAFRGERCQSSHVLTWPGLTVGTDRHNRHCRL